jgi:hypothetical protein
MSAAQVVQDRRQSKVQPLIDAASAFKYEKVPCKGFQFCFINFSPIQDFNKLLMPTSPVTY